MFDFLWPQQLPQPRLPCPSLSPWVCSPCCPLNHWCHPTISSSITSLFPPSQSFPESGSFSIRRLFTSGGKSIGPSASASVLPMNIQDWLPLVLIGLISFCPGDAQQLSTAPQLEESVLWCSAFVMAQISHLYMTTGKIIALTRSSFVGIAMSLIFNTLSRFATDLFPRSKCLLISWFQSPSAVIWVAQENKFCHCFHFFSHLFAMKWWDQYSCLENPMEKGAWWATVHGLEKSRTGLTGHAQTHIM